MMLVAFAIWGIVASLVWIVVHVEETADATRLVRLAEVTPATPPIWPRLSVVIAACNEGETIGPALATLCALDYPDLEIVVVDDRSTDATGALVDAAAHADRRVRAVHVTHLPDGWLGKVHALSVGTRAATGELVLYTDADVHFAPDALRRAVGHLLERELDHLTVLPDMQAGTLVEDVLIGAMGGLFLRKTAAAGYAGIGAFNLVRREAFADSEGFEFLRLEVVDDVGVGLVMRRAGKRSELAIGAGMVKLVWYGSGRAMAKGMEKNLFALIAHFRWSRLVTETLAACALVLGPPIGIVATLAGASPIAGVLGAAAIATAVVTSIIAARTTQRRVLPLLLMPLGEVLLAGLAIRSALVCSRRRGVEWRGTTYPLALLRAHQRVKI